MSRLHGTGVGYHTAFNVSPRPNKLNSLRIALRARNHARASESLVGVAGFEPATPSSRTRCATRLRYTPTMGRHMYTVGTKAVQQFATECPSADFRYTDPEFEQSPEESLQSHAAPNETTTVLWTGRTGRFGVAGVVASGLPATSTGCAGS
jgi:hypothetical protein